MEYHPFERSMTVVCSGESFVLFMKSTNRFKLEISWPVEMDLMWPWLP